MVGLQEHEAGSTTLGKAAWHIGILVKVLDVIIISATRAARRALHDTSREYIFDKCTEAHTELQRRRVHAPFQLLIRRSPPGLPLEDEKELDDISASLTTDGRR